MTPSQEALDIEAARRIYSDSLGTPREELAREYLRIMIAKAKRKEAK